MVPNSVFLGGGGGGNVIFGGKNYLAVLGLSCGTWDLRSLLWPAGSLIVASRA